MSAIDAPARPPQAQRTPRAQRMLTWVGPLAVTVLGGWLRFARLGSPPTIMFDETYYAKDALSLLTFGVEHQATDTANTQILQNFGDWRALDLFQDSPSFVVHPPAGKWVIASGEWLFGATPFGWRVAVALLGTLSILILARSVLRMTGSALWGTVAGLLLAIDGMAIVMSRSAVLDGVLAFFVLAGFWALLVDRDHARGPRAARAEGWSWWRPWRLVAAAMFGLACSVKWSGLWYLAAFVLLSVAWEVGRRRQLGIGWVRALLKDGIPAGCTMIVVAVAAYLASWTGWFISDTGWDRHWAGESGVGSAIASLWHYHAEILNFHTGMTSPHSYQSPAFGWLVQARPTSFFYEGSGPNAVCDSPPCAAEVLALGNPLIWWAGILALLHQMWRWIGPRDWRAGAAVVGVLAGWAPWLLYPDRTIFAFYSVVFTPFLVMALTLSLASIATAKLPEEGVGGRRTRRRIVAVTVFLLLCVTISWWFYPVWSGLPIESVKWSRLMWLPTWV